jgi:hypothetical protein
MPQNGVIRSADRKRTIFVRRRRFAAFVGWLCGCPLPFAFLFRPRAIDGYFRYNSSKASKHGTVPLRALIRCALMRSAQWRVQQGQRQWARWASLCSLSDARLTLWKEEAKAFTGTDGGIHACSVCALPCAGLLALPCALLPHCGLLLCRSVQERRQQTSGGCCEAICKRTAHGAQRCPIKAAGRLSVCSSLPCCLSAALLSLRSNP